MEIKLDVVNPDLTKFHVRTGESRRLWSYISTCRATLLLVAANLLAFVWIKLQGTLFTSSDSLSSFGANWGFATLSGQWWRLLTSLFVHTEAGHLLLNMLGLFLLGREVEKRVGTRSFILLYFSSGFAGGISLIALRPAAAGYGASLSVLGLLGGLIGFFGSRCFVLSNSARWKLAALLVLAVISVWGDIVSFRDGNPGHVVGLLTGVVLGIIFRSDEAGKQHVPAIASVVAAVLVASAVAARQCNLTARSVYAAACALDAGKTDAAAKEIDIALQAAPDDLSANQVASEIFMKMSDYPRAEKAIRRVLARNRDNDYSLYLLGIVELRTNRCAQAGLIGEQLRRLKSRYASILSQSPCYIFPNGSQKNEDGRE